MTSVRLTPKLGSGSQGQAPQARSQRSWRLMQELKGSDPFNLRARLYALAGGVAVLTILLALEAAFNITPVAAARSLAGLLTLAACGALGGWLFARLLPRPDNAAA